MRRADASVPPPAGEPTIMVIVLPAKETDSWARAARGASNKPSTAESNSDGLALTNFAMGHLTRCAQVQQLSATAMYVTVPSTLVGEGRSRFSTQSSFIELLADP